MPVTFKHSPRLRDNDIFSSFATARQMRLTTARQLRLTNMFSSQPPPASRTVCPSPTGSDHHHYLSDPALYQGPIDVTLTEMPEFFDILLSDIDEEVLHNEVSTILGSAYLSETPCLTSPQATVNGIMFGKHDRVLVPLVVRLPRRSHSHIIHFLYDSGSPHTFLSQEVELIHSKHFTLNY